MTTPAEAMPTPLKTTRCSPRAPAVYAPISLRPRSVGIDGGFNYSKHGPGTVVESKDAADPKAIEDEVRRRTQERSRGHLDLLEAAGLVKRRDPKQPLQ